MNRQIILDTETTGLSWEKGNRVVEIGCVELVDRRPSGRVFQRYINPERAMEQGAEEVTGLTSEFLSDKPLFAAIVDDFIDFIRDGELVIHNAAFDVGFLNYELSLLGSDKGRLADYTVGVIDTLILARERFPGQRNSLDALCRRLVVDNTHRTLHGALLDAQLLADVYLGLTSGQGDLGLAIRQEDPSSLPATTLSAAPAGYLPRRVATAGEINEHEQRMQQLQKASGGKRLWPQAAQTINH